MKKIALILLLSILLTSTTCDGELPDQFDHSLGGAWNMTGYVFFGPSVPNLQPGDVIWEFETGIQLLTIENNVSDVYPYLPESGTHTFSITGDTVIIEGLGLESYTFEVDGDMLTLVYQDDPQIADDELGILFTRRQ